MTARTDRWIWAVILLLILGSALYSVAQWRECKAMGHSTFYCVGHVLK